MAPPHRKVKAFRVAREKVRSVIRGRNKKKPPNHVPTGK